jgi:hypothetical protein
MRDAPDTLITGGGAIFMKRVAQALLFAALLAAVAFGLPPEAQAYNWTTVTVDAAGVIGWNGTSIAVNAQGDPAISYWDETNEDLKFAICDMSASADGNCDQSGDWSMVTVDALGEVGHNPCMALDTSGNPMISYYDWANQHLKFAMCDLSASANGNCDQGGDWSTAVVDAGGSVGWTSSIAVDVDGDPVISYYDSSNEDLKFAICDLSASASGSCDQGGDWSTVTVDAEGSVGWTSSIAVDVDGDPVISYYDATNQDLKFAVCDLSASANGNCDQGGDWSTLTVDTLGDVGRFTSTAVSTNGDMAISYSDQTNGDLKLAICELAASANGSCDQTGDWSTLIVDAGGTVGLWTSIALDANENPMISYYDSANHDLKFAMCDLLASANGNCDQTGDWSVETVDVAGDVGRFTSIAVGTNGRPMISYHDLTNGDLKFAIGSSVSPPTPTPTPPGGATRTLTIPARSWANFAWTGDGSPREVADCFGEGNIAVIYRLNAETQVFERWISGGELLSTMGDVARFDALLALNGSDQPVSCVMADPSPVAARTLTIPARSWANFAWTGDSSPQEVADCFGEGNIAVMYRLDAETQVFERWISGNELLSTMGDVAQFDALLALNASDQPATCQMPGG